MKQVDSVADLKHPQGLSGEYAPRLTNWVNEPTLITLKNDFMMSRSHHDIQVGKITHWNNVLKVEGQAKPKTRKGRSKVQPKLVRRQNEWRYSALTEPFTGSDHLFKIKPATAGDVLAARQNQTILNYQFRTKLNRIKFIDDYVRSTVDDGTCIVQTGWKRFTIPIQTKVPVYDHVMITTEEQAQQFTQALQAIQQDPRKEAQLPDPLKQAINFYKESGQATIAVPNGKFETVTTNKIIENHPTALVLDPHNVYIDPSCQGDLAKAMFVIVTFETNKAELLKEPKRYKNLDAVNWEGNSPLSTPDHATMTPAEFNLQGATRKRVVAYEYWGFFDINDDGKLVPFVCTWIGDTVIRMELNPFPDQKLPFVLVTYNPKKRELYGEPDAELLEDNQAILGAVMRGSIDLLGRSANAQQGFAKGMLDPLNRRRFENGEDYEFNPNLRPQEGIVEHKYPEIPQSAMMMMQTMNQEAEAITGVKSFSGGLSGNAYGDVAAGIRGALDAASKREMAILRRLAKGITEIGVKFASMNEEFLSEQEVVPITDEEFVTINKDDLKGDYNLEVDISTAEVDDAQAKDLAFMLQTMGPNMPPDISINIVMSEIARLKRMPELAKKLETYKPEPDPIQEQLKQLTVAKAQKEIEFLQSQIDLNQSRAVEAEAKTDKIHTDTAEQASGIAHERAMEHTAGQAEANQNLEVTKALLKPTKQANGGESKPNIEAAVGFNHLTGQQNKAPTVITPSTEVPNTIANPVDSAMERDQMATGGDPRYSLGSKFFDPNLDPSTNPNVGM